MGFRENLKEELNYRGILVKELADKTKIPKGTLDHYLAEKCTAPIAENVVKIAQALNTTVEYLVTGKENSKNKTQTEEINIRLCKKYYSLIQKIDLLSEKSKDVLENLVEVLEEKKNWRRFKLSL